MSVKKKTYKDNEIPIYDGEAILYQVGETWYLRCWLKGENKYARKSLRTKSRDMAIERGKQQYHQLMADVDRGVKFFAMDVKQGIEQYLQNKQTQVVGDSIEERGEQGGIVSGRYKTIETHLKHFQHYVKKDAKLRELNEFDLDGYVEFRRKDKVKDITIRNEVASINAAMGWIYDRLKQTDFRHFKIPEVLKHVVKNKRNADNAKVERQTFTREEWMSFVRAMRTYTKDCIEEAETDIKAKEKLLVRYFCLFAANSGMRSGEQFNLHWRNVSVEELTFKKSKVQVAKVYVDFGTSKKRQQAREFWCRGGEYIERWREIAKHDTNDGYVFSVDGKERIPKSNFMRHWWAMLELADFDDERKQHIVPYSLRHFCVSQRVMAGLSYAEIAESLGTSATEVEKTYKHLQDEQRRRFALADYKVIDGVSVAMMLNGE